MRHFHHRGVFGVSQTTVVQRTSNDASTHVGHGNYKEWGAMDGAPFFGWSRVTVGRGFKREKSRCGTGEGYKISVGCGFFF